MNKKTKMITSLALIGLLAVGGTYAYLQTTTDTKENTFTFGENISGDIKEPGWDGVCFVDDKDCKPGNGEEDAKNFHPSQVIAKDPQLKNTSESTPAYAAVTIAYPGVDSDKTVDSYEALSKFATVSWNTKDWDFNEDYTQAIYKKVLNAGEKTTPVFNDITIKADATHPDSNVAENNEKDMHNFQIDVQGYFAQAEEMNEKTSVEAVKEVFANVFGNFVAK